MHRGISQPKKKRKRILSFFLSFSRSSALLGCHADLVSFSPLSQSLSVTPFLSLSLSPLPPSSSSFTHSRCYSSLQTHSLSFSTRIILPLLCFFFISYSLFHCVLTPYYFHTFAGGLKVRLF